MNTTVARFFKRLRPRVRDVVGIDIGTSEVLAVRLNADRSGRITVAAAEVLPGLDLAARAPAGAATLQLPRNLQSWSAAAAYAFPRATVKLLSMPANKIDNAAYADLLGIARPPESRLGYLADASENRNEVPVLAVGVPTDEIDRLIACFPPGKPVLGSVEVAGLAALTTYQQVCAVEDAARCDLVIDAGDRMTTMSICFKGKPLVIRQFPQGAATVVEQVVKDLGVDAATARDILGVRSIDIRSSVHRVYEACLRQLSIAVDFGERRSGQRLQRVFLSGKLASSTDFQSALRDQTGVNPEVLNPWIQMAAPVGALSALSKGREPEFAAATGAALGVLEVP